MTHGTASSSNIGEVLTDRNVVLSSGADATAKVSHIFLQMISFFLITFLLISSTLLVRIAIQITHGTASTSSEAPTDRSASAANEANAPKKVRHLFNVL